MYVCMHIHTQIIRIYACTHTDKYMQTQTLKNTVIEMAIL